MDEILKALEAIDGTGELIAKLRVELGKQSAEHDSLKAKLKASEKASKALEGERDRLKTDLDTRGKSESEQLDKLTTERDEAKAALEAAQAEHRQFRIEAKLLDKLGIPRDDSFDARKNAALKLGDWSQVDLDDAGELVGVDEPKASLAQTYPWIFEPAAQGHGGPPAGGQRTQQPGGAKPDPAEALREAGREAARATLEGTVPSLLRTDDNAAA